MQRLLFVLVFCLGSANAFESSHGELKVTSAHPIHNPLNRAGRIDSVLPDARPRHLSTTTFSTPNFWWPLNGSMGRWTFELQRVQKNLPSGFVELDQRTLTSNWLNLELTLVPGVYRWRARPAAAAATAEQLAWKQFIVEERASSFDEKLVQPAREYSLLQDRQRLDLELALIRYRAEPSYRRQLESNAEQAPWLKPNFRVVSDGKQAGLNALLVANQLSPALEAFQVLSAQAAYTGDANLCQKTIKTLSPLLAFASAAELSFAANDLAARSIAYSLWVVWDRCATLAAQNGELALVKNFKAQTLLIVERFLNQVYNAYVADAQFARYPLNSHGWTNLAYLCGLAAATRFELPDSLRILSAALPVYVNTFIPWASEGDGFGNGSAYAFFAPALQIPMWDLLKSNGVIDFYQHPSMAALLVYLQAVYPAHADSTTFGNGAELPSDRRVIDQLVVRVSSARLLEARKRLQFGEGSLWFASIGEVSLRSKNLPIQIYFRSSPFGSFNHSHPDQNSFIVNWNGTRLLGRSGTYDAYESAHYKTWYKTTAAQSALTFEDNEGQKVNSLSASGSIRTVGLSGPFTWIFGSAASAYSGVKRADRLLILHEDGNWLVVDFAELLNGIAPKSASFNLHIPSEYLKKISATQVQIQAKEQTLCANYIDPSRSVPELPLGSTLARQWQLKTDRFSAPIRDQGARKTSWVALDTGKSRVHVIPIYFALGCADQARPTIEMHPTDWVIEWMGTKWMVPRHN